MCKQEGLTGCIMTAKNNVLRSVTKELAILIIKRIHFVASEYRKTE